MLLEDFEAAIDEYGADLTYWPDDLRLAANALLERSEEARTLLADELRLEAAFAAQPAIRAPSGLADRIAFAAELDAATSPSLGIAVAPAIAAMPRRTGWSDVVETIFGSLRATRMRTAFILTCCFAVGAVGAQFIGADEDDMVAPYVASLYADLAY